MMVDRSGLVAWFWNGYRRDTILVVAGSVVAITLQTAALLMIVPAAVPTLAAGATTSLWPLIDAVVLIKLAVVAKVATLMLSVRTGERACADLTVELADRISRDELADIERLGRERLLGRLSTDFRSLSAAVSLLIPSLQTLMLVAACTLFGLVSAPEATVLLLVFLAVGARLYRRMAADFGASVDLAVASEDRLLGRIQDLIRGFKELKTAAEKGRDFAAAALGPAVRHARRLRRITGTMIVLQTLVLDFLFYGVLGVVAFVLPPLGIHHGLVILLGILAYLVDRMAFFDLDLPLIRQGEAALRRIRKLHRHLATVPAVAAADLGGFSELTLREITFRYPDRSGDNWFSLGPIDLRLASPEIVLVAGGNGSGKSTLLKLLCGLYRPTGGAIEVDGRRLSLAAYRSLFSTVFTDYHLFRRLHGVDQEPETIAHLLELLGLTSVVRIEDGRFSTLDLSTGQRKRLALVAAWLENRPVLVFDEWTADQDPEFRQVFFSRLLPELKARGRTVIAATHDDRYFHYGDRLIRLEAGRIAADLASEHAPGQPR